MGAPEAFTATAEIGHYIAGRIVSSPAARRQPVFNPATGAVAREVVLGTASDVDAAVAAAQAAFAAWADTPPIRRARVLNNFLGLLNEHRDVAPLHGPVIEMGRLVEQAVNQRDTFALVSVLNEGLGLFR